MYNYGATAEEARSDPKSALFFIEKDLRPGRQMTLRFTSPEWTPLSPPTAFLPRTVADSIPFSSTKLPEILRRVSVEPDSAEALTMKNTLESCEEPAARGESKVCATSLESMVDFVASKLGNDAEPLTTTSGTTSGDMVTYRVGESGAEEMKGWRSVSCHGQFYPYAVYLCHERWKTKAYRVPLVGVENGTRTVEAVAVCHMDTSYWNPKHSAFQVLDVKPGSFTVCHFVPLDHFLWVSAH